MERSLAGLIVRRPDYETDYETEYLAMQFNLSLPQSCHLEIEKYNFWFCLSA